MDGARVGLSVGVNGASVGSDNGPSVGAKASELSGLLVSNKKDTIMIYC